MAVFYTRLQEIAIGGEKPVIHAEALITRPDFLIFNESPRALRNMSMADLALREPRRTMIALLQWVEDSVKQPGDFPIQNPGQTEGFPPAELLDPDRNRMQFNIRELPPELDDASRRITDSGELDRVFDAARILLTVSTEPEISAL